MKKIIVGIIAVFCLQVALIGNTWLSARFEPIAEQPGTYELAAVDELYPKFMPALRNELRTVSHFPRRRSSVTVRQKTAARRFEIVARSRQASRPVSPSALAVRDVKKAEPRAQIDKKSFFAKAWPVIKKPYSWVRTLASKLD